MKSSAHLFADLTALLEDIHGVAVEGQSTHASDDMRQLWAASIRRSLCDARRLVSAISRQLGPAQ